MRLFFDYGKFNNKKMRRQSSINSMQLSDFVFCRFFKVEEHDSRLSLLKIGE